MTCIVDTPSVNLTVAAGQLSADLIVDPASGLPPNPLVVNAAGVYVQGADGWLPLPVTLAYSSASSPTYVATTSADLTSFISPGAKIKFTQTAVVRYFEVVAITAATITLYGGDQQVLANAPITAPYFGLGVQPAGFPTLTCSTAMPAVAYDGMRVTVIADATNGVEWIFRFRSASASAFKWELVGGGELVSEVETSESVASTSYGNIATPGPAIAMPFPGDYDAAWGNDANPAGNSSFMSIDKGGGPSDSLAAVNAAGTISSSARTKRLTGMTVSTVTTKYRISAGGPGSSQQRWLRVRPVRISA